jgi:hypothetical protein
MIYDLFLMLHQVLCHHVLSNFEQKLMWACYQASA